jgi:Spy/CpxP family protein refolding chaperone
MGAAMVGKSSVGATGWATATLAGVVAGLLAAHLFPLSGTAAAGTAGAALQVVDRTHKGDRLDAAFSPASDLQVSGRTALRQLMQRARSQQLREMCEPPASPYVDPQLAKLPGRCLT